MGIQVFAHQKMSAHFDPGARLSRETFKQAIVSFVIQCKTPFEIVAQASFKTLLEHMFSKCLSPTLHVPSTDTITRWIREQYNVKRDLIISLLSESNRRYRTQQLCSSPIMESFLAITDHWIDEEWNRKDVLIDFEPIHDSHTGE
jgi:hypothetical protein